VSPDGRSVYVAAYNDEAIVRFDRDTVTGALTAKGCIAQRGYNPAGCAQTIIGGLQEPYIGSVTVSPDGTSVYAAGSAGPSIAMFRRTSTGALKPRGCIADPANNPESCVLTAKGLVNPYRVVVSSDGTSAYAADYATSGVVRFTRDRSTGSLKGKGCIADPAHDAVGCAQTAPGLYGTEWVAISADGRSLYAAGTNASAVVRFARDRTTGALTPKGCIGDVVNNPSSCPTTAQGLSNVQSLALSADGTSLYAPSALDNSITHFRRAT
jgi:DNA-binding beta-propeller fold protein YncE